MNKPVFSIIGGDTRFRYLAEFIAAQGNTTIAAGFDTLSDIPEGIIRTDAVTAASMADIIILPLPATIDGKTINAPFSDKRLEINDELIEAMKYSRIYAGLTKKLYTQQPSFNELKIYDYSVRECFLIKNAQATAEAVVMLAIEKIPVVLRESRVLVTGCGRIGKFAADFFHRFGAYVCGASQSAENAAIIASMGVDTICYDKLCECMNGFDLVINTADAPVLTETLISAMRRDACIIDVASAPGGTDFEAAERLGIKAVNELGLPGRYSPATAAKIIFETITEMEGERYT